MKVANFEHNVFEKADQILAPFSKRSVHFLTEMGLEMTTNSLPNLAYRFSYSFMPQKKLARGGANFPANHMYRQQGLLKAGVDEHAVKMGMVYRF